ncbi:hypothetical protein GCM10018980_10170 [Streptomyces capoamus]|uniref:Uncharacterized protein n=1 Tax=Streptomyces capoamus TaxID=68183 RepID=A0A919C1Z5_9ACTN|nr:hypothetical protein GCM10010501_35690 [Streptomyces libani subsp. rufus]GHG37923.1 hypothetical protein GCM10018980_10170 [Streptomyces capoamus]
MKETYAPGSVTLGPPAASVIAGPPGASPARAVPEAGTGTAARPAPSTVLRATDMRPLPHPGSLLFAQSHDK